ncbi:hypothetical protein ACQCVK_18035 [Rossellomorea vietnamensis]|uniref:Uncharacterized protein n=1 Tax=Rossellomorea aquimaris TaxID=189382 RepID=A0A5D4UA74_9BACI|nr:hypothetical protein [Rossellomorea aquimaris]TYS84203.1 hypothetical protein FZC80_01600 [Rossellomorea aquimaris]
MSFFLFFVLIILLNTVVALVSKYDKKRIIISALLVMFLCTPLVLVITMISIASAEGAGIGASVAGFTFGGITFVNGIIILFVGLFFDA